MPDYRHTILHSLQDAEFDPPMDFFSNILSRAKKKEYGNQQFYGSPAFSGKLPAGQYSIRNHPLSPFTVINQARLISHEITVPLFLYKRIRRKLFGTKTGTQSASPPLKNQ